MSLFVWGLAFGLLGLLGWLGGGPLLGPSLPDRWRERVGDWYFKQSAAAAWRPLFVGHSAGFELCAASHDGERDSERVAPFGEGVDYEDPANLMGRWHGRPAGVVESDVNAITTPLHTHVGIEDADMVRNGQESVPVTTKDEEGTEQTISLPRGDVPVRRGLHTVDLTRWHQSTPHAMPPSGADTTERFAYLSQVGFNTTSTVKVMMLITAYAAGAGIVAMINRFGGSASVDIPLLLRGVGL